MQQAFLKMDQNRDGRISKRELLKKCQEWNIPSGEAQALLTQADMDFDGAIDFQEFVRRFNGSASRGYNQNAGVRGGRETPPVVAQAKPCGSDIASLASVS